MTPTEVDALLKFLTPQERAEIDSLLETVIPPVWTPLPGPQTKALESTADEVFWGGGAGGGKTFLLLGLALSEHRTSIIFRREYPQLRELIDKSRELLSGRGARFNANDNIWRLVDGRSLEFGAVQHEWDVQKYQGRPHAFLGFDELPHFTRSQYRFLMGWNRTTDPNERCRVVATGNPPTTPEGRWVVEEWAPWLDEVFHDPAEPGELRFYTTIDDKIQWYHSAEPILHKGERIIPRSRTFFPARLEDNPILEATGYRSRLQAMPEPLRSQLLYGDFKAGTEDDPWQVLPTAWIRSAQARWTPQDASHERMSALGVDVARGGADKTVLAARFVDWFAPLQKFPGQSTPDGPRVVQHIVRTLDYRRMPRRFDTPLNIDVIGVGASVFDGCGQLGLNGYGVNFGKAAPEKRDASGSLGFVNLRAWAYWILREALDPSRGGTLALPPDPELLADLAAPKWAIQSGRIKIESKEEIVKRIGRSPDCADAVVLGHIEFEPPLNELDMPFLTDRGFLGGRARRCN